MFLLARLPLAGLLALRASAVATKKWRPQVLDNWFHSVKDTSHAEKHRGGRGLLQVLENELEDTISNRWSQATLDEDGYIWLGKLSSTEQMAKYVERAAELLHLQVKDRARLLKFAEMHSGQRSLQSFYALKLDLLQTAAQEGTFLEEKERNDLSLMASKDGDLRLSQSTYEAIVATKDTERMKDFIQRVAEDLGFRVVNFGGLSGIAPFFSGETASQSYAKLRAEVFASSRSAAPWATSGEMVALNEEGMRLVQEIGDVQEMVSFIKKLVRHTGCKVKDAKVLEAVAKQYSGSSHTYSDLDMEVRKACGLLTPGNNYGSMNAVVGPNGVLQITMPNSERQKYSSEELRQAKVVVNKFTATDAYHVPQSQLDESCVDNNGGNAPDICEARAKELDVPNFFGDKPGCKSKVEAGITDSHHRALLHALERNESDWTAIIEDDIVALHMGMFDDAFAKAWSQVPSWAKMVRLGWCTFEQDLGLVSKTTWADAGRIRVVDNMEWRDKDDMPHYYTGGCTTGYMVHRSLLPELLGIFPCCCPIDCCLERQFFYAPTRKDGREGRFRGEQVVVNLDAWDSKEDSFMYTSFNQAGVFVQDNRDLKLASNRPEFNTTGS